MTLLHRSDLVELHHGDALEVLPTLDTESCGLVVTDPPYGEQWRSNRRAETFDELLNDGPAAREGIHEALGEAVRCVGQNRHLYVFGPSDVLAGLKVSAGTELVWDKGTLGAGDVTAAWGPQHEPITFATSKHRHAGEADDDNLPVRLRKGSVLRFARPTGRKVRHPSEKPIPLLRELLESSSRQGDLVLDPFAGIGSTGVAAILSGRRAVLIELDYDYAMAALDLVRLAETIVERARAI